MNIGTEHTFREPRCWHSSCEDKFGKSRALNLNHTATMNKFNFKGDWNIFTGRLKQQIADFTGDQQQRIRAQDQQLLGQIQNHLGQMDESAERALHEWITAWDSH
jgi:uncharacterized protein YjbJ (UPF0337 family)